MGSGRRLLVMIVMFGGLGKDWLFWVGLRYFWVFIVGSFEVGDVYWLLWVVGFVFFWLFVYVKICYCKLL